MAEREFDGFKKTGLDSQIEQQLAEHCERFSIDPLTAAQLFPVLGRRQWLKRLTCLAPSLAAGRRHNQRR